MGKCEHALDRLSLLKCNRTHMRLLETLSGEISEKYVSHIKEKTYENYDIKSQNWQSQNYGIKS